MANLGSAVLLFAQGLLADVIGLHMSFLIPAVAQCHLSVGSHTHMYTEIQPGD